MLKVNTNSHPVTLTLNLENLYVQIHMATEYDWNPSNRSNVIVITKVQCQQKHLVLLLRAEVTVVLSSGPDHTTIQDTGVGDGGQGHNKCANTQAILSIHAMTENDH